MPTRSGNTNVFVRDLATGTTTLVSATPGGLTSDGYATEPVFSPDGQSLAYVSNATDLTSNPQDPNPWPGITTTTVSTPSAQASPRRIPASRPPPRPRRPARSACNLGLLADIPTASASPIPSVNFNVFLTNLTTGTTSLVSVTPQGQLSSGMALDFVFSPDGRYLAFTSERR